MAKKKTPQQASEVSIDRRKAGQRRDSDRRKKKSTVATERRQSERRKVHRRRQIDPTTCERDYSNEEIEFMHALDEYKRDNGRMFPTCSEILEVVRKLGYERTKGAITDSTGPTEVVGHVDVKSNVAVVRPTSSSTLGTWASIVE